MNNDDRKSILVVDDESSNITVLTHILSPDYNVYAAKNGKSAIIAAEKHLPDIILLDILMPEMDGYDVLAALKNSAITQNIPVIFISGLSKASDEERGLALGAVDYITKPFSPAIVKLRVQNQIKMIEQLTVIEQLSAIDQLTNLFNRRSFEERFTMEWGRAQREQRSIGILMVDVDHFKKYNDTFGHLQGDAALQAVASTLSQELKRTSDFVARWGGEEFVVLLPNTDTDGALHVAGQLRKSVEGMTVLCKDGTETTLTVSIGLNVEIPEKNTMRDSFIAKADQALYRAKAEGRNRVSVAVS